MDGVTKEVEVYESIPHSRYQFILLYHTTINITTSGGSALVISCVLILIALCSLAILIFSGIYE